MWLRYFVILFVYMVQNVQNANILGIFPTPTKSHFNMYEVILKALARNGHEVDVVSFYPLSKPYKRYNDIINLKGSQADYLSNITVEYVRNMNYDDLMYDMLVYTGTDSCKSTFALEEVKKLRDTKKKYDLVITEYFCSDCMLGWGHHFNVPVVGIISSVNLPWFNARFANPDNPSYIPHYFVGFNPEMALYQRIINSVSLLTIKIAYHFMSGIESNRLAKEFFGNDLPPLEELAYNTSLILANSHFSINSARPTVPNVVEVGGVHIIGQNPLTRRIQDLMTTGSMGVIYLSMGSMVTTESFPKTKLQAMFDAFSELNYKVMWKANRTNFPEGLTYPRNIVFQSWMPQLDILCHSRVKLFVSHGGLMGTQEAVYCGVPMLGIPLFADQDLNIRQYENMGLAVRLDYDDISKENVKAAAKEILENPQYKKRAEKASINFKDRPISALDTSVYWIEYVLKHNGAPQLRSAGTRLYWFQYYLLDVIFIVAVMPLLILKLIVRIICRLNSSRGKLKQS